jgi:hypothetical protein
VGLGDAVGVGGATTVPSVQKSVITGSSPGRTTISRHVGSVTVSPSISQVTAPSSTARRVVSPTISTSISEGTDKSSTVQKGRTNSYEGFWAKNRMLPRSIIICKRGNVRGFCTSMVVSGPSSSVLPSPKKNLAPPLVSVLIRPPSWIVMPALPSIPVQSDSPGHCNWAFPEYRFNSR